MAKLKNVVKQLSAKDFKGIYDSLIASKSEKSAYLLKSLRERELSDRKIMEEIEVNANAYYTMRSRLNQKIDEHLVEAMESPRTDILKKVANLNEVLFSKRRTISITALKKMERELIDYDLANELTSVYKSLKKLHINSPEYFQYSQAYNRHVAYMLAVDKAEDLLADYFKKFAGYYLSGDETLKLSLNLLLKEMQNVSNLYESHRLYVILSLMRVAHKLFVDIGESEKDPESIQDTFGKMQKIFATYGLDPLYYHLNLVLEFLKLEYFSHYRIYLEAEKYFEEVNDATSTLLMNYPAYTFSARLLVLKLERALRIGNEAELHLENTALFDDFEEDPNNIPCAAIIAIYKCLTLYYAGKYEEAAKTINKLLNEVNLRQYPIFYIEAKALLGLLYCLLKDVELFNQLSTSLQRNIRLIGTDACENVQLLLKILKIATSEAKREKPRKITALVPKLKVFKMNYFSPTSLIKMDDKFIESLTSL